jgi:hypothetical protein
MFKIDSELFNATGHSIHPHVVRTTICNQRIHQGDGGRDDDRLEQKKGSTFSGRSRTLSLGYCYNSLGPDKAGIIDRILQLCNSTTNRDMCNSDELPTFRGHRLSRCAYVTQVCVKVLQTNYKAVGRLQFVIFLKIVDR